MVRKLLGTTLVAALMLGGATLTGSVSAPSANAAVLPCFGTTKAVLQDGNATYIAGVVAYEALSSSGAKVTLPKVGFNNYRFDMNNATSYKLKFDLNNAKFKNADNLILEVVYDGNSTVTLTPSTATDKSVTFDLTNSTASNATIVALYDKDTQKLPLQLNGGLKAGDTVKLQGFLTANGTDSVPGMCFSQDIILVQNQFVAMLLNGVDTDYITVNDNGVAALSETMDSDPVLTTFYGDNCRSSTTCVATSVCPNPCPDCELVCEPEVIPGAVINAQCALPGACNDNQPESCTIQIFQNPAFLGGNCTAGKLLPVYTVQNLAYSEVTFKVEGDFKGVTKVTIYNKGDLSDLAECEIDHGNNTAICKVKGEELFQKQNVDINNKAIDFGLAISVDGKTQLYPREFKLSAEISGGDIVNPAVLNWGPVVKWDVGKAVAFKVPYLRADRNVTSAVRIENTASRAYPVSIYVSANGVWKLVDIEKVDAGKAVELLVNPSETAPPSTPAVKYVNLIKLAKDKGLDLEKLKDGKFGMLIFTPDPKYFNVYATQAIGSQYRYLDVMLVNDIPNNLEE